MIVESAIDFHLLLAAITTKIDLKKEMTIESLRIKYIFYFCGSDNRISNRLLFMVY